MRSPLLVDLVSWWTLDEASGTRVDQHGGYDLSVVGSVGSDTGLIGDAANFTGSGQYLSRPNGPEFQATSSFTVSAWVNLPTIAKTQHIIGRDNNPTREWFLYIMSSGNPRLLLYGPSNNVVADVHMTGTVPPANTWVLLIAWYDAAVNQAGVQVSDAAPKIVASGHPAAKSILTTIGRSQWNVGDGTQTIGLIDEVAFWRRVLTSGERAALYNSGSGISYPG